MDKIFWGVVRAAEEQSRCKANMVARGDGKFGPSGWPQNPSKPKKENEAGLCTRASTLQPKKVQRVFFLTLCHTSLSNNNLFWKQK